MSLVQTNSTITLALSCTDRHASATWYQDMLGFALLHHFDDAGWSELHTTTPGVTPGLGEQARAQPGNCTPVFGVADIAAARAVLEGAGVRFDGPTETIEGMVSTATFHDPDDNAVMLARDLSGAGWC